MLDKFYWFCRVACAFQEILLYEATVFVGGVVDIDGLSTLHVKQAKTAMKHLAMKAVMKAMKAMKSVMKKHVKKPLKKVSGRFLVFTDRITKKTVFKPMADKVVKRRSSGGPESGLETLRPICETMAGGTLAGVDGCPGLKRSCKAAGVETLKARHNVKEFSPLQAPFEFSVQ